MMRRWLRKNFFPVPIDEEVRDELATHIELQTQRYLAQGMSPIAARNAALARFGDVNAVRTECRDIRQHMERDMRRSELIEQFQQDVRFALRTLGRNPLFTGIAVLTIALGIGASTAIFSVVDAVLFRSLPYTNASRTVVLWNSYDQGGLEHAAVAAPEYFDYKSGIPSLDEVAAFRPAAASIVGDGADPEQIAGYVVTPNLFTLLGAAPELGRTFAKDEGTPSGAQVVVLSHKLWIRRFGGDSAVVDKVVRIGGVARTVIGVMPADVNFPDEAIGFASAGADVWIPNTLETQRTGSRGNQGLAVIGHIRNGATQQQLTRDIALIESRFKKDFADRYASNAAHRWSIVTEPLIDAMVGAVRPALLFLLGAVGVLLLIACANVSGLLLARASLRRGEMAVRLALGAGRTRLLMQLLTESVILSLCGGVVGVMFAWSGVRLLAQISPGSIPRLASAHLNGSVLLFSFIASACTGLLVGIVPALQQSRTDLRSTLSDGARGSSDGFTRRQLRAGLVTAELALALVILNCAALFGRSFSELQRVEPGFHSAGITSMYMSLPTRIYDSSYKFAAFASTLQTRLSAAPGIAEASVIYPLPLAGDPWSGSFDVEGLPKEALEPPHAEFASAMPGYFHVMSIPLIAGRDFTADDNAKAPDVVIVDEDLAKKYWPNLSAIGKRINPGLAAGTWATVIGVAKHVHSISLEKRGEGQLYLSMYQRPIPVFYPVVKTTLTSTAAAPVIHEVVKGINPDLPVSRLKALDEGVSGALARPRFNTTILIVFATVALGLASVGLYGVMSYLVAQRTREIGIRIALGGQPGRVRLLILRESLSMAVIGLGIGTAATLALTGALGTLLFGIKATDPLTYGSVAGLLLAVAAASAYLPARRASRVDPILALRE